MELLFVCVPMEGHLRPLLNVAAALQTEPGVRITFAALDQSRRTVEGAGVPFVCLGSLSEQQAAAAGAALFDTSAPSPPLPRRTARSAGIFTGIEEGMYPMVSAHLAANPGRYTAMVTDQATLGAHDAAAEAGLPVAVLHQLPLSISLAMAGRNDTNEAYANVPVELPGCLLPERMGWFTKTFINPRLKRRSAAAIAAGYRPQRDAVRARLGLPALPRGWAALQLPPGVPRAVHVVSGTMELETERPLPEGWHMSGFHSQLHGGHAPALDPSKDAELAAFLQAATDAGEPVVYVALGSLVSPHAGLVQAMAAAFSAAPARFVWSLKAASQAHLPLGFADSGRAHVTAWAPQAAVLAHPAVKCFVTHGGPGSVGEGLAAGLPLIALPFFSDQHVNAQHIENKRLGAQVDPSPLLLDTLPKRLGDAIGAMLRDEGNCAARAAALGERLRASDGVGAAARLVLDFARAGAAAGAAASEESAE